MKRSNNLFCIKGFWKMKYHIGVVEDDPNIQNIVSAFLKKAGFEVSLLNSAEEGIELWQSNPPDMWILDIMLPGMDGYDFCKKIRNKSDVPIIIISAKDEEVDKIIGLELGGDDYLTKPFSPRSEEHTSELQSRGHLVCRLLLE